MNSVSIQCLDILFSNIKAVIFDKDGTLANSEQFLVRVSEKRLQLLAQQFPGIEDFLSQAFGLENNWLDPTGLIAVGSRRDCEIAAAAAIATRGIGWIQALAIAQDLFREADLALPRKAKETPLFPDALNLLRSLRDTKIKVGIVSADTFSNVQDFVDCYQLHSYVQLSIGVEAGLSKPDPRLFYKACDTLGVLPNETLMIGDSDADMAMACAAGAAGGIGVRWGWQRNLPLLAQADVMIDRFEQCQISPATKQTNP